MLHKTWVVRGVPAAFHLPRSVSTPWIRVSLSQTGSPEDLNIRCFRCAMRFCLCLFVDASSKQMVNGCGILTRG